MIVNDISFGTIKINGENYSKDLIIDNGVIKKRDKEASKKYANKYGHTPLSADENIPWNCRRLIVGTGQSSALSVMEEVRDLAVQMGVELKLMSTPEAVIHINDPDTNFILHLTC